MAVTECVEPFTTEVCELRARLDHATRAPFPVSRLRAEDLWRVVRDAGQLLRGPVLAHVRSQEEIVLPALGSASSTLAQQRLLREEIERRVGELSDVESALLRDGLQPGLLLRATGSVEGLLALSTLALRYTTEVVLPELAGLPEHDVEALADAVAAVRQG